jgi:hypothetical protein
MPITPIIAVLLSVIQAQSPANRPPTIEYEPPGCAAPMRRARLCADVFDDRGVGEVRVVFRARGARGFYWTLMSFDGARYCAWLPAPLAITAAIEHYVEAFDDAYETSRTRSFELAVREDCEIVAEGAPSEPALVGRATPATDPSPDGFDPDTFSSVP